MSVEEEVFGGFLLNGGNVGQGWLGGEGADVRASATERFYQVGSCWLYDMDQRDGQLTVTKTDKSRPYHEFEEGG